MRLSSPIIPPPNAYLLLACRSGDLRLRASSRGRVGSGSAQHQSRPAPFDADSARLAELPWRSLGPAVTSGRVVDLAVLEGPRELLGERLGDIFYVASASGGVWKTVNAGTTWESIP